MTVLKLCRPAEDIHALAQGNRRSLDAIDRRLTSSSFLSPCEPRHATVWGDMAASSSLFKVISRLTQHTAKQLTTAPLPTYLLAKLLGHKAQRHEYPEQRLPPCTPGPCAHALMEASGAETGPSWQPVSNYSKSTNQGHYKLAMDTTVTNPCPRCPHNAAPRTPGSRCRRVPGSGKIRHNYTKHKTADRVLTLGGCRGSRRTGRRCRPRSGCP